MPIYVDEPNTDATLEERCELLLKSMQTHQAKKVATSTYTQNMSVPYHPNQNTDIGDTPEMPTPSIGLPKTDNVNSPAHYASRTFEVIDVMEDTLSKEQFIGYLLGCALKYLMRWDKKDAPVQDLMKAQWYLRRLLKTIGEDEQHVD